MTFRNPTKRAQMAHVTNLISMSRLDGQLTQNEYDFILAIAKALNLTQAELDQCMKDSDNLVIEVPQSEDDRIEYMKNLVTMIFSEGTIDKQKRSFAEHICEKFGYNGKETVDIIYDELRKKAGEPDGNEDTDPYRSSIENGARCLMENKISEAFDFLLHPASQNDETARRLFLRIPNGVYPMFMLTDSQVDELELYSNTGLDIAQYALGRYYQLVRPNRENLRKARELFNAAVAQGLGEAYCGLALLARDGYYEEADPGKYNSLMFKAIDSGSKKATYLLGKDRLYGLNGMQPAPQEFLGIMKKMLENATWEENKDIFDYEPDFFDLLGRAYEEAGQKDEAEKAYIHAVSMGYYEALSHLAILNCCDENGDIVEREMFDHYIKIGIEHNDAWSFAMRGLLGQEEYDDLTSKEQERRTAEIRADLEKASRLGDNNAPAILGKLYYFGTHGFEEDDESAWKWFNIGSAYGSSECYSMMAQMISEGHCPRKVSEKFHAFCILCAYRFGDESMLEDVIQAYSDGLLDDFKNEIEKYYIPRFNDIAPADEESDDDSGEDNSLDDMEISDIWS